jgi:hypothetical protein
MAVGLWDGHQAMAATWAKPTAPIPLRVKNGRNPLVHQDRWRTADGACLLPGGIAQRRCQSAGHGGTIRRTGAYGARLSELDFATPRVWWHDPERGV